MMFLTRPLGLTFSCGHEKYHPRVDIRVLVLKDESTVKPRHVAQGVEVGNPKKVRLVGAEKHVGFALWESLTLA